jgi:hypothetical protein
LVTFCYLNNTNTGDTSFLNELKYFLKNICYESIPNYDISAEISINAVVVSNNINIQYRPDILYYHENGGRSRKNIMQVVNSNLNSLKSLYDQMIFKKSGIRGRVIMLFAINDMGDVIYCAVKDSEIESKKFQNSLIEVIYTWKFGRIYKKGDVTEVVYPFVFYR